METHHDHATEVAELFARYFPTIRARCNRLLRDNDEAADMAQEAFMRLWQHRKKLRDPSRAIPWIYRTSTNLAISYLRKDRSAPDSTIDGLMATGGTPESIAGDRELIRVLARKLPPTELEIGILSRFDEMTYSEIAEVTGRSERTVRRVLEKLSTRIDKLRSREMNDA